MTEMIDGLLVLPGEDPRMVRIENTVKGIQKLIGGHFQAITFLGNDDVVLLCDDDGKLKGLEPNFWFENDIIVGPVLFVGTNELGDDFDDISFIDAKTLMDIMPRWRWRMNAILSEMRKEEETK